MARPPSSTTLDFIAFIHRSKRFKTRAPAAARGVMRGVVRDAAEAYQKKHGVAPSPSALTTAVRHLLVEASGVSADALHGGAHPRRAASR